jgi:glycosyltransferase involved in cell wall biosynthesis
MNITVAICTWNRSDLLKQTLEQAAQLLIPQGIEWELLVVNNNSTDATDEVLASFASRLPLRTVFEAQAGLSHARNRAVREAHGDYILWTDDDVLVDENWLAEYFRAFSRWPDAAVFGGMVEPWFAGTPPRWLPRAFSQVASAFATRDLGPEAIPLTHELIPYGANYAVRRAEQLRYLYDPDLGVRPGNQMGGEETTVVRAMLADGIKGWWVPEARVRHYIPEARQTTKYLRRYFYGYGEYCGRQVKGDGGQLLFGKPRWMWRQALESEIKYRLRRFISRPEIWVGDLVAASEAWGQMRGYGLRHETVEAQEDEKEVQQKVVA